MKFRKWLVLLSVVGAAMVIALLVFASTPPAFSPTLPSPNGYDDFMKAAQMLVENSPDYSDLSEEKLRRRVAQNEAALQLVRTGLGRDCRVPLGYTKEYVDDGGRSTHLPQLSSIKSLAIALRAEGVLARMENRNGDAAGAYLDAVRLGQEAMRGGVLIDGLVGIACEAVGSAGLKSVLTNLDANACHKVIHGLETIEERQVPYAEVKKNEAAWAQRAFPFFQRVAARVMRLVRPTATQQIDQKALQKFQAQEMRLRSLMIELAARAYELEKGKAPTDVNELTPEYFKAVPKDPVTGADMVVEQ